MLISHCYGRIVFHQIPMKLFFSLKLAALATLTLGTVGFSASSAQAQFTESAVDQSKVVAIARPYGAGKFDLLVIEQVPNKKQCWSESGSGPVVINPLLLNFDFTGHCRRATDSNGYSVRIDGQDYGLEYLLRVVPRGNELVLVATPRNPRLPELAIGSTQGLQSGFMKIQLYPGWQFTKRTFNNKALGHFYFSGSQANIQTSTSQPPASQPPTSQPQNNAPSPVTPVTPAEPVKPVSETPVTPVEPVKPVSETPVTPVPPTATIPEAQPTKPNRVANNPPKRPVNPPKLENFRKPY